jgi:hypothetical protein
MKVGQWIPYQVPAELVSYFRPDASGCIPALVCGVTDGKANAWLFPNIPGAPPMIKMGVFETKEGDAADGGAVVVDDDRLVSAQDIASPEQNRRKKHK